MMLVVIWLVASFVVGAMAPRRNRSFLSWTILSQGCAAAWARGACLALPPR